MKETKIECLDICLNEFNMLGSCGEGHTSIDMLAYHINSKIQELDAKCPEWRNFSTNVKVRQNTSCKYGMEDHLLLEYRRYLTDEESEINRRISERNRQYDLNMLKELLLKYKDEAKKILT